MSGPVWQLEQSEAKLQRPRFSAIVDARQPHRGLHDVQVDGSTSSAVELLGVDIESLPNRSTQPADCYVRVGDLVAIYADAPQPQMRTEIYWRATSHDVPPSLAAVEMLVSVQTSLLDSRPQSSTSSRLPAAEVLQLLPRCYLLRPRESRWSYAEMVHPADPGRSEVVTLSRSESNHGERVELRHHLFAEGLEKGVILRARVLAVILDRAGDEQAAAAHYAAFIAQDPPLTR